MALKEHIYSVLVVSASQSFDDSISSLMPVSTFMPTDYVHSINSAQRKLLERSYDIIIINSPLPDDFGVKFAIDTSSDKTSVVLLFVRNDVYDNVFEKVCDYGVFTLRKPISPQTVSHALDWLRATSERLRRMEKKSLSLQDKMEEIKLVNRAKWALINSLGMSETDAHRYIEKQAMDRCVTRREIADWIIKTYK